MEFLTSPRNMLFPVFLRVHIRCRRLGLEIADGMIASIDFVSKMLVVTSKSPNLFAILSFGLILLPTKYFTHCLNLLLLPDTIHYYGLMLTNRPTSSTSNAFELNEGQRVKTQKLKAFIFFNE